MDNKYAGMTVNERLYLSGLMEAFDKAVKSRNYAEVVAILKKVELTDESINPILHKIGFID